MQVVAAGWAVYQLTGSAASVGVLAAVSKIPTLLGTPIGGVLADRFDHKRLAVRTLSLQVIPPALLALLALDHALATWEIYLLIFLGAVPSAITGPVLSELIPHLVPESIQRRAVADAAVSFNIARSVGPAIGGGIVVAIGVPLAFGINALSFAGVIVMLLSLPPEVSERSRLRRHRKVPFGAGAKLVWDRSLLRMVMVSVLAFFVFVGPIEQIMPAIAADHGESAGYLGVFLSALAIGGMCTNPLVRRLNSRETPALLMIGGAISAAGLLMIPLALSRDPLLDWLILFVIGAMWEVLWVTSWTTTHFRSPEGLSGQGMGFLFMTYSLGMTVGALAVGWLFDTFGVEASLITIGMLVLGFGAIPALAARRIPDPA